MNTINIGRRLLEVVYCASLLIFMPFAVVAQNDAQNEVSASDDGTLEEIVVTGAQRKFAPTDSSAATKIPMDITEIPQSITIVSRELMDMTSSDSFNSVASLGANTFNGDHDVGTFFDVLSRGFRIDFRQGYKINSQPIINEGLVLDFDLVERVELVRGPSSIAFGQSDYGTTINTILKGPKSEPAIVSEVTIGNNDKMKIMTDINGPLPGIGNVLGRLILAYEDTGSGQDYAFKETLTAAPSLTFLAGDSTEVNINSFFSRRDLRQSYGFGLTDTFELPDVPKEGFFGADWGISEANTDYLSLNVVHTFANDFQLSAVASYISSTLDWLEPYTFGLIPPDGNVELDYWESDRDLTILTGNITLNGNFDAFGTSNEFMIDAFFRRNEDDFLCCGWDYLGTMNAFDPDPTSVRRIERQDLDLQIQHETDLGLGAMVVLHPTEKLTLMAGARWLSYENTPKGDNGWFWSSESFDGDDVVPRFAVTYAIRENTNIYASYSEGVMFRSAIDSNGNQHPAESGEQWEYGVKSSLRDGRLTLALGVFELDRNNVTAPDPDFPMEPFSILINGQSHSGIEFEVIGEPIPGLNLYASYGYLDVEITDAPSPGTIGQTPANIPTRSATLYASYEILDGPLQNLSFGGGLVYVGDRGVDSYGTLDFPSYTRVDARVVYDGWENVSLSLIGVNLTDEDIYTSFSSDAYLGINFQNYRSVMAKITVRY